MKSETTTKIEQVTRELVLANDELEKVMSTLLNEFNVGLGRDSHANSTVKMFPTFVRDVPTAREEGKFLSLDLGGTNFRVLLINIKQGYFKMEHETFATSQEIMLGSGEQLFDHIADCLASFMEKHNLKHLKLPLGFTFSFPCQQVGLTEALLVNWTKGFKCSGVEGSDVVRLLREAIKRRKDIEIDVMAVLNDTTGCLMSCAWKNRQCRIGVIVGTGTNACYMEHLERVQTVDETITPGIRQRMIVNTEWGAFGDNGVLDFMRTDFDKEVDTNSLNAGKQLFEKMISGMYMGELVRCILSHFHKSGLLFSGHENTRVHERHVIDTSFVSMVESDKKGEYTQTKAALLKMDVANPSNEDCEHVKLVCSRVSTRAAHLVSAAIATILNKIQRPHTTVGVDGSVYRYHPLFHDLMERKISELIHPEYKFDLMLSEDGSGRGAALVAAVAHCSQMEALAAGIKKC
ncbi:Hexokinase type 2 [Halotydeus destructor]|nr:Hexokinase type 2 [Halotydeus destructor]